VVVVACHGTGRSAEAAFRRSPPRSRRQRLADVDEPGSGSFAPSGVGYEDLLMKTNEMFAAG